MKTKDNRPMEIGLLAIPIVTDFGQITVVNLCSLIDNILIIQ